MMGIVALVLVLSGPLMCGAGIYFYARFRTDRYDETSKGQKFGKATDQRGCIEESLRQVKEEKPNTPRERYNKALIHYFTRGCFETCKATYNFCEDAPVTSDFQTISYWATAKCRPDGLAGNGFCVRVFEDVVEECRGQRKTVYYPN